jgi:hypothetical protein
MKSVERHIDSVDVVWETFHYDMPITGICRHNNQLCRFETDYDTQICTIYSLTTWEKFKWLCHKKCFEICVGYHCTYPKKVWFHYRKPKWFWKRVCSMYYYIKTGKWTNI